jgi:predicted Zn-dependent protease
MPLRATPSICSASIADICGKAGRAAGAQRALKRLLELNRRQQVDALYLAEAYLGMGHQQEAITWLETAYAQHSNVMVTLKVDPVFDPLRDDPRFQKLLLQVGLAQ